MSDLEPVREITLLVRDLDAVALLCQAVSLATATAAEIDGLRELRLAIGETTLVMREAADGLHLTLRREGLSLVVGAHESAAGQTSATSAPAARRRAPRAKAPRAARPERKTPDISRSPADTSARAPRRIVRPRVRARKVSKK